MSGNYLLALVLQILGPCNLLVTQNEGHTPEKGYRCGNIGIHEFKTSYQYSIDIYNIEGRAREDLIAALKKKSCQKKVKCTFPKEMVRIKEDLE